MSINQVKSSKRPLTPRSKLKYRYRFHNQLGLMVLAIPVDRNIFANHKIDRNRTFI